uniref:Phosphoribosyltransferase domain-containing protein n=1 Tax=viral metagenome TaxID=1070528 RepID=A0A6C0BLA8_9ZZZZ
MLNTPHNLNILKGYNPDIINLLLDNTRIVTRSEVEANILQLVELWKSQRDNLDLYVNASPRGKIGSEQWLYMLVRKQLPPHRLITRSVKPTDGSEVLFIDDWALSGCNAAGSMENVLYRSGLKDIRCTFIFNVITEQANTLLPALIEESYPNTSLKIYSHSTVQPFNDILTSSNITQEEINQFNTQTGTDEGSYAIISDYKIPNTFGSYPKIYRQIWTVDRQFIHDLERRVRQCC